MTTEQLVNTHITANSDYYLSYCRNLYRGRYLAEDLFQEFYIAARQIKEERVLRFQEQGKLTYLFIKEIRSIFNKRGRKKTVNAPSSPLFETCNICDYYIEDLQQEDESEKEQRIEAVNEKVKANLQGKAWYPTAVLLQAQDESISEISRKTGIDRTSLSKACKQAAMEIKRYVESDQ